jgi:hypothetical protein
MGWGVAQEVEYLLSKHKAQNSHPSIEERERKREKERERRFKHIRNFCETITITLKS